MNEDLSPVCFISPEFNKINPLWQSTGIQLITVFGDVLNDLYNFTIQVGDDHAV